MRKHVLIVALTMVLLLPLPTHTFAETMPKPPEKSREELYHDMFVMLLLPYIDHHINEYYTALLTELPVVYPYMVDVIHAERADGYRSFKFLVTLEVTPVIGPHIAVGKDRLTFEIGGETTLTTYEHIETYELPNHWQH